MDHQLIEMQLQLNPIGFMIQNCRILELKMHLEAYYNILICSVQIFHILTMAD